MVLGALILAMLIWLALDFLSPSKPARPHQASNIEASVDLAAHFHPSAAEPDTLPEPEPKLQPKAPHMPPPKPQVSAFTLSDRATEVLTELETTYLSTIRQARLEAQLKEQQSSQKLSTYLTPSQPKTQTKPLSQAQLSEVSVKSIVQSPERITAWIAVGKGSARPVQRGAWVGSAKVADISKDAVRFLSEDGTVTTKYVDMPTPIAEVQDEPKR